MMLAGSASAGTFSESESNNTLATANDLGTYGVPGGSLLITGSITDSDVDWYEFSLSTTSSLTVFAGFSTTSGADGILQVVNSSGVVIDFDDDSGVGLMPALQIESLAAGTYYFAMSGFGDVGVGSIGTTDLADGSHTEIFDYKLAVGFSIVPAPSAMALLGMGGLAMSRRRR